MHDGEIHIDSELVGALVAAQFPKLADLPVSAVRSTGTVNAIYRIGDDLCARLPRIQKWALDLDRETLWLPKLASGLSLQVPEPVGKGHPEGSYPSSWSIYRWIDGEPYADRLVDDESQAARDLAQFVLELRRIDPAGADVIAAWSVFSQEGRDVFRDALGVDDETWNRARGFAVHQAAMIIPYYGQTNPRFVTLAKRTVEEVLADINR